MCPSVRPSVCLSVRHTFLTMFPSSYHHEIFRSYYQWQKWRPCKRSRSKVKVTEVTTQLNRIRTVTQVWIHIWWWNDAYSLIMLRRGALLFFKVIRQISRSRGSKNRQIWPGLGSIPFFQFNSNSNSFTFNYNYNSFGMKNSNSNSNSNSFLSIPFYQFLFNLFLKPN